MDTEKIYYSLVASSDPSIIGVYPQVKIDTKPLNWLLPPLNKQYRFDTFLDFEKYFDITLKDEAHLTDLIECGSISWGIIISEKLKLVISQFYIPPHRFYPVYVFHQGRTYQYYWFHFYVNLYELIDLQKSTFEIYQNIPFAILETQSIQSESYFKTLSRDLHYKKSIRIKEIYLNKSFPYYDIFENKIHGVINISEDLLEAMNKAKFTGIEALPYNVIKHPY